MKDKSWRLLPFENLSGPENMARDEALVRAYQAGGGLPLLRFYTWTPGALSLGRFQKAQEDGVGARVKDLGLPVVRRMTGGGAIWHHLELTYSLVCVQQDLETSSVKASFERLCSFLLAGYAKLGLKAGFAYQQTQEKLGVKTPMCFAGKEEYDLLVEGQKLGGNAQRRVGEVIFQHGSIPLVLEWDLLAQIFGPHLAPQDQTTDLVTRGYKGTAQDLAVHLARSFEESMGVSLLPGEFSPQENELKQGLTQKYENALWTWEGK